MDLAPASDSGVSDSDNLTRFNNERPADALQFQVGGTFTGATVTIYADGTPIAAPSPPVRPRSSRQTANHRLPDRTINITARQTLPGQGESPDTEPLPVTIDATAPHAGAVGPRTRQRQRHQQHGQRHQREDAGIRRDRGAVLPRVPRRRQAWGGLSNRRHVSARGAGGRVRIHSRSPPSMQRGTSRDERALNVTVDTAGPTITSYAAPDVVAAGGTVYQFTATYADDTAIDVSTLAADRIRVSDLAAFNAFANFYSVDVNSTGRRQVVTYQLTPPGGSWDSSDNRRYSLIATGSVVRDTAGNPLSAARAGRSMSGSWAPPPSRGRATRAVRPQTGSRTSTTRSPAKALSFTVPGTVPGGYRHAVRGQGPGRQHSSRRVR